MISTDSTTRSDQLVLQEDSQFTLEDLLNFQVDDPRDSGLSSSGLSDLDSLLSPRRSVSSGLGSEHGDLSIGDIIILPSASSSVGAPGGFSLGGSVHGGSGRGNRFGSGIYRREEDERLFDPGFGFDDQGNMFDHDVMDAEADPIQVELPTLRYPTVLTDDYRAGVDLQEAGDNVVSHVEYTQRSSSDSYSTTVIRTTGSCRLKMILTCTLTQRPFLLALTSRTRPQAPLLAREAVAQSLLS